MNTVRNLDADARGTLFEKLGKQRVGMLGIDGSGQHMQPMTHHADPDAAELWFISAADTDLVRAVGLGARAHHCLMTPENDFFACLSGTIAQSEDRQKLDELWSPVASAWFEAGQDDPDVVLLRFTLKEAALWATTDSAIAFGFEIARSNLSKGHQPDVGDHVIVRFD